MLKEELLLHPAPWDKVLPSEQGSPSQNQNWLMNMKVTDTTGQELLARVAHVENLLERVVGVLERMETNSLLAAALPPVLPDEPAPRGKSSYGRESSGNGGHKLVDFSKFQLGGPYAHLVKQPGEGGDESESNNESE